jgi:hypothetical protein
MVETLTGEVLHVVPPEKLDEYDLDDELRRLAASRYVLVCRKGGAPSVIERVRSFLLRDPIEPVTLVADADPDEGEEVTAIVEATPIAGVYDVRELR